MKNILITGGAGYFGRAFASFLLRNTQVERICIYSRDEWKQAQLRAFLHDPDQRMRYFLGDVRDSNRLSWAMQNIDTVIHAAALKRIETAHYNPVELVKTNLQGTMNVIDEANKGKTVKKVLFLSTDKACQPDRKSVV